MDAYSNREPTRPICPLTFTVRLSDGRLSKRHQDHLRERRPDETEKVGTWYSNRALTYTNYWTEHASAEVQGAAVTYYVPTGRRHDEGDMIPCYALNVDYK